MSGDPAAPVVIVFDMDDTLYAERDYVQEGFALAGAAVGRPGFGAAAFRLFDRGMRGVRAILEQAAQEGELLPAGVVDVAEAAYRRRPSPPWIALRDGMAALLDDLAPRTRLALISDGRLSEQQAKAAALGLDRWFDPIILTDAWGRAYWKPHPRAFEAVMTAVGAPPHRCVYVGDNRGKDFDAPRMLGWTSIRLHIEGQLHCDTAGQEADLLVRSVDALSAALSAWLPERSGEEA